MINLGQTINSAQASTNNKKKGNNVPILFGTRADVGSNFDSFHFELDHTQSIEPLH